MEDENNQLKYDLDKEKEKAKSLQREVNDLREAIRVNDKKL